MKRQRVKFPWDLYWENKTDKLKRSITVKLQHIYPAKRSAEFQGKISGFPCGRSPEKPGVTYFSRLSRNSWKSPESQGKLIHSFWALMCKKGTELQTRMISSTLGSPLILRFPRKTELKSLEKRRENFLKCMLIVSTLSKSRATLVGAKCCHHWTKLLMFPINPLHVVHCIYNVYIFLWHHWQLFANSPLTSFVQDLNNSRLMFAGSYMTCSG